MPVAGYASLNAAAVARGLSGPMVINRTRRGWSVADALATPPLASHRPVKVGQITYASKAEALAAAGLAESTVRARMKRGLSLAEALALGKRPRGRRAGAIREAALAAGADPIIVNARLRIGWTLARALAVAPRRHKPRNAQPAEA